MCDIFTVKNIKYLSTLWIQYSDKGEKEKKEERRKEKKKKRGKNEEGLKGKDC